MTMPENTIPPHKQDAANDPTWHVNVSMEDHEHSAAPFLDNNGNLSPKRALLHELIIQAVSERKILTYNCKSDDYEHRLASIVLKAQTMPDYMLMEQNNKVSPLTITRILDDLEAEYLPLHNHDTRTMLFTAGGAGTGKTRLNNTLAATNPDIYFNAVQINPDDYKDLLADPKDWKEKHGLYTHHESSTIAYNIMMRIKYKMERNYDMPHVRMDVAVPFPDRMEFAKHFQHLKFLQGTAPVSVALKRSYFRGHNENGEVKGRVMTTKEILDSAAKTSCHMINIFDHPDLDFTILNTNVPKEQRPTIVATWSNEKRRISIHDFDCFINFVERQLINQDAKHVSELYDGVDCSPERLAEILLPYLEKNITIDLLNHHGRCVSTLANDKVQIFGAQPITKNREDNFADKVVNAIQGLIHSQYMEYETHDEDPNFAETAELH